MRSTRSVKRLRRSQANPAWLGLGLILVALIVAVLAIGPGRFFDAFREISNPTPQPAIPVENGPIRMLAAPASMEQGGVTLTIETVIADPQRTVIIYRVEGLPAGAAAAPTGTQSRPVLRLADGSEIAFRSGAQDSPTRGYAEFAALPAGIQDIFLDFERLPLMLPGSAPENWRIPLHLQGSPGLGNDPTATQPSPTATPIFTPAPTLPPATLDALVKRIQGLLQQGYAEFSGRPGWIHMIDESYTGGSEASKLRIETWYELDSQNTVIRYVSWQRKPDGALVQSSAAKGQTAYDFIARKAYPYTPRQLTFDWGLLRSLQEDVPQFGLKVWTEDSVCADRLCVKITIIDEYKTPIRSPGQKAATIRSETETQLDLGTGRILQSQTSFFKDDGTVNISGGHPLLIERVSNPPAEVLAALEPPAFP